MKNQQPQLDGIERRQMIITLNIPESTIVRIEALDKSGRRYDVQGGEFAALITDYEVEEPPAHSTGGGSACAGPPAETEVSEKTIPGSLSRLLGGRSQRTHAFELTG